MSVLQRCLGMCAMVGVVGLFAATAEAQPQTRWAVDAAIGIDFNVNGNINSGAIGTLNGQTAAILPSSYGDVYGSGIHLKFGGGYMLDENSEIRGVFTWQTADADLVRLGDLGPSSLYGQYTDYKTFSFDVGFRRYMSVPNSKFRGFGEVTLGAAAVEDIDLLLSAPQSNLISDVTDFYDQSAAFTWGINIGALFPVSSHLDVSAQIGLRHVGGMAEVDQLVGTGLDSLNDDSSRLTFPMVVGVRFKF
jgi:hypothetical protein